MKNPIYSLLLSSCLSSLTLSAQAKDIPVTVQTRDAAGKTINTKTVLPAEKTAIIVIDMWNFHWCMTATERVSAMVPRMNAVLDIAREQGMQIVWNPSDVVTAYAGEPGYERAVAVIPEAAPEVREGNLREKVHFTAPYGACLCGPGLHCHGNYGWDGMHPDLKIDDRDLFSSSTDEIYALLKERGITNVIYMGVHTNICVFGKPGALSFMWKAGMNCMLARDLNDAFTTYDPAKGYTPDDGTTEIDENLQAAGIPNINMGEAFQKAKLWKQTTPVDYVRFVPWGRHERPYEMEQPTTVTLTAPWLDGSEIRYTLDGSEPTAQSPLYTTPLKIAATTQIRAAAFRKGQIVSLPSEACYVLLPPMPPKPQVYLENLPYITNAYLKSVGDCMWMPKRWQSFEGKPLRVSGKTYAHGMGFRAPSGVQYELKPEYKRFVALVGTDDNSIDESMARFLGMHVKVVFCVYIDGQLAGESPVMRIGQEPWRFDITIPAGSRRISLSCRDEGTRNVLNLGNWVDAGFVTQ